MNLSDGPLRHFLAYIKPRYVKSKCFFKFDSEISVPKIKCLNGWFFNGPSCFFFPLSLSELQPNCYCDKVYLL